MASRRTYGSYNDGCASAHALDIIGERWALIVVRELLLGPKRYADIQADIPGIGPGVLARRPQDLEESGVLRRRTLPAPAHATVYELTPWGYRLEAVNNALAEWATSSPGLPLEADMSPDTLVLAMRAHARPTAPDGPSRTALLTLSDSRTPDERSASYLATMAPDGTTIVRAYDDADGAADAAVETTTRDWKAVILGGTPLSRIPMTVVGDPDCVSVLAEHTRWDGPPATDDSSGGTT